MVGTTAVIIVAGENTMVEVEVALSRNINIGFHLPI